MKTHLQNFKNTKSPEKSVNIADMRSPSSYENPSYLNPYKKNLYDDRSAVVSGEDHTNLSPIRENHHDQSYVRVEEYNEETTFKQCINMEVASSIPTEDF